MMKCPKCDFSQPKDRYCAHCGVDMDRFKPSQIPFTSRILSSSGFYVFLATVIVIATSYLIFHESKSEIENSVSSYRLVTQETFTKKIVY